MYVCVCVCVCVCVFTCAGVVCEELIQYCVYNNHHFLGLIEYISVDLVKAWCAHPCR